MGSQCKDSLNCKKHCMRLPGTGSRHRHLCLLNRYVTHRVLAGDLVAGYVFEWQSLDRQFVLLLLH